VYILKLKQVVVGKRYIYFTWHVYC